MEILASLPTLKNRGNLPDGEEKKTKKKSEREIVGIAILPMKENWKCKSPPQWKTSIFWRSDTEFPAKSQYPSLFFSPSVSLSFSLFLFSINQPTMLRIQHPHTGRQILMQTNNAIFLSLSLLNQAFKKTLLCSTFKKHTLLTR